MKKILQITTVDMTTYCFHLAFLEFLKKRGFDVYAAFTEGRFTSSIRAKGIKTFNIPIERRINPIGDFISFLKLYKLIKEEKFDIVHSATSKAGFIGRAAAHFARVGVIIHTCHELPQNSTRNQFLKFFYRCLEKIASRWTNKIITVSKPNLDQIIKEKIASLEKISLIPNGIEVKKFDIPLDIESKKKELGIDPGFKVIGSIGRLEPVKGHKYLLEAAQKVIKEFPRTVFLIIGQGQLKDKLAESIKAKGLEKNIIMLGFREDLIEILYTLDIFVSASLWEGFGVAVAEAMICGLPVVSTAVGGIIDFVIDEKTGILVPAQDSKSLSDAIVYFIRNPKIASAIGQAAKEKIKNEFSQEEMIRKLWEVYSQYC